MQEMGFSFADYFQLSLVSELMANSSFRWYDVYFRYLLCQWLNLLRLPLILVLLQVLCKTSDQLYDYISVVDRPEFSLLTYGMHRNIHIIVASPPQIANFYYGYHCRYNLTFYYISKASRPQNKIQLVLGLWKSFP